MPSVDPSIPLVIAGGHSTFNPEPMHAFVDAFVIGEGEEVIDEIIDCVKDAKNNRRQSPRLIDRSIKDLGRLCSFALQSTLQPGWHILAYRTN